MRVLFVCPFDVWDDAMHTRMQQIANITIIIIVVCGCDEVCTRERHVRTTLCVLFIVFTFYVFDSKRQTTMTTTGNKHKSTANQSPTQQSDHCQTPSIHAFGDSGDGMGAKQEPKIKA